MTRDGHKAIDGITKDAFNFNQGLPFAGLTNIAPQVVEINVPKVGLIDRVSIYNNGSGVGGLIITLKIWDKNPLSTTDPGIAGVNDILEIQVTGPFAATPDYIVDEIDMNVPFKNNDQLVKGLPVKKLYAQISVTGVVAPAYAGKLTVITKEQEEA